MNEVTTPRAIDREGNRQLANAVRALLNMQVDVATPGQKVSAFPLVNGEKARLVLDLTGLTVTAFAPANLSILEALGSSGGALTFNGIPVSSSGDAQVDETWGSSMVFDCADARVHNVVLGGATSFALSNFSAGKEVRILLWPGASDRALTWQTGWHWENGKPTVCAATYPMTVRLYCSGTTADSVIANYGGGYAVS